ncbi:MAG: DUF192 domain-containing protein [Candidatus Phaeomarinobacter sp.]
MRTLAAAFVSMALVLVRLSACAEDLTSADTPSDTLIIETSSGTHVFSVELADTDESRQRGLMFREDLALDAGMLFDFETPRVITMWMRNTPLPLDMIFISEAGRVVHVAENTVPFSEAIVSSRFPALSVFEVNAGTAQSIGLRPGDHIRHALFKNVAVQESPSQSQNP